VTDVDVRFLVVTPSAFNFTARVACSRLPYLICLPLDSSTEEVLLIMYFVKFLALMHSRLLLLLDPASTVHHNSVSTVLHVQIHHALSLLNLHMMQTESRYLHPTLFSLPSCCYIFASLLGPGQSVTSTPTRRVFHSFCIIHQDHSPSSHGRDLRKKSIKFPSRNYPGKAIWPRPQETDDAPYAHRRSPRPDTGTATYPRGRQRKK
jgi:hypothetical protein